MSHRAMVYKHPTYESVPGYWDRHELAMAVTTAAKPSLEAAVSIMLKGWAMYADAHQTRYESGIGEDGVLGVEWQAIGRAFLGLLNGDLGRLDGGALDHAIRACLTKEGFPEE